MNSINVLIIEDTPAESDALIEVLTENNYSIVGVARTNAEALQLFYNNPVDIVVIDVFLNGSPDGISFAETINAVPNASKPFVFLTSSKDRQIFERAKLTQPFSFLMKPFNELEILYALEMAVEKFYKQPNVFLSDDQDTVIGQDYLFIKKNKALKKVLLADIIYVEVEDRYCKIVTTVEKFLILISLTKIMELLDPKIFCRTHRNFLINIEKIIEIVPQDNLIWLVNNHSVVLSDKYKDFSNQFRILK
ncbi:LytR/AlgR family response regulator transcription factor [Flavobacterium sp. 7A]|uniref:LytR/AlgR family response regulator transcription factor n=1 Tax=Flavobacterium sp. 7A TaxID=2940571 RepID=UPI002227751B|nr:response regulator transcription factor [Flavobacterium sp. 7A]MCW2121226.1 DNA-binding LytR/AlgR family response regulator [Flavobacterium sp. 7A]